MKRQFKDYAKRFVGTASSQYFDTNVVVGRFLLLAAGHGLGILFGLLSMIIMVRALGPEGYGYIGLALAVLNYGLVFSNFGSDLLAVRETARERSLLDANLFNVASTRMLFGIPVYLIVVGVCYSGVWPNNAIGPILIISLSTFAVALSPLWAPQALEKVGIVTAVTAAAQIIFFIFVLIAANFAGDPMSFAWAKLAADATIAVILLGFVMKKKSIGAFKKASRQLVEFWRRAAPLGGAQILRSLALGSDLIVLSVIVPAAALGVYAVSFRIFTLALSVTGMFFIVVLPIFSRQANESIAVLQRSLTSIMKRMAPVAGLIAVAAVLLAEPVIITIFSDDFAGAILPLQILMAAAAANFINRGYRQVLLALGRSRDDFISTAIGTGVNLGSKIILIPTLGLLGAALSTALGEIALLTAQRTLALRALREPSDTQA